MKGSKASLLSIVLLSLPLNGLGLPQLSRRKPPKTLPFPISVPPAQNWEGIAGEWNTFVLQIGHAPQFARVYISTISQQTWVVDPRACVYAPDKDNCWESRGGLVSPNDSSTYEHQGLYDWWIEKNLGYSGNGLFGYDTVELGYRGEDGPSLDREVVGSMATEDFFFGHFGLHPNSTNFTGMFQNAPSFLATLRDQPTTPPIPPSQYPIPILISIPNHLATFTYPTPSRITSRSPRNGPLRTPRRLPRRASRRARTNRERSHAGTRAARQRGRRISAARRASSSIFHFRQVSFHQHQHYNYNYNYNYAHHP